MTREKVPKHKTRNSNLEILRILAMVLIILSHFSMHGFDVSKSDLSANKMLVDILRLGKYGVNLFIMVSAYFMCSSAISFRKNIKIILETCFYSVTIFLIFKIGSISESQIAVSELLSSFLPTTFGTYWFVTDYILLSLFSPFLNLFIKECPKQLYQKFILLFTLFAVIISGTIPQAFSTIVGGCGWFIGLYLIIGYIKKYVHLERIKKRHNLFLSVSFCALLILSSVVINFIGYCLGNNHTIMSHASVFLRANNLFVFVSSLELFLYCVKTRPREIRFINLIASTTFGIYLIHDNPFVRRWLWTDVFHNQQHLDDPWLLFYTLGVVIAVFVVCAIIDFIRQKTIERLFLPLALRTYDHFYTKAFLPLSLCMRNKMDEL